MKRENQLSKVVPLSSTCAVCHIHTHRYTDKIHKIIFKANHFFVTNCGEKSGDFYRDHGFEARASKHKASLKDSLSHLT